MGKKVISIICIAITLIALGCALVLAIYIPHYKNYSEYKEGQIKSKLIDVFQVKNPEDYDLLIEDGYDVYRANFLVYNMLNCPIYSFKWNTYKKGECRTYFLPENSENVILEQNSNFYHMFFLFKKGTSRKEVRKFIKNCEYSCSYVYCNKEYTEKIEVDALHRCDDWLS